MSLTWLFSSSRSAVLSSVGMAASLRRLSWTCGAFAFFLSLMGGERFLDETVVAFAFQNRDQFAAAAFNDTPGHEHVHEVRLDVVQHALVVGDDEHGHVGRENAVDAVAHDL